MKKVVEYLKKKFDTFPRIPLSVTPTPCHRLNYISDKYGVEVYCKRDDMTGFGFGGNKTRKLEILLAEALEHDCDTIVTSGGLQSNFCRITASAAAFAGLSAHLVLGSKQPENLTGNLILNNILGAHLHYIDSTNWSDWEEECGNIVYKLESQGKKVFPISIGGSVPMGAIAYTMAFVEILEDQERLDLSFDQIIHASGSAGTHAGLIAGKAMTGWQGKITGISVGMELEPLTEKTTDLASQTAHLLGGMINSSDVIIDDSYIGEGYAIPTDRCKKAIELFARKQGIFLDHVYTGKAAGALLDWLDKGKLKNQKVLFIHTGGTPELFS